MSLSIDALPDVATADFRTSSFARFFWMLRLNRLAPKISVSGLSLYQQMIKKQLLQLSPNNRLNTNYIMSAINRYLDVTRYLVHSYETYSRCVLHGNETWPGKQKKQDGTKMCRKEWSDECVMYNWRNWQDAQLSQRDRAAGCVIVFAKSSRLKLGDNNLRTL